MLFNRLITSICAFLLCVTVSAQTKQSKIKFGDIKPKDFESEYYSLDSSVDAVYLINTGSARYTFKGRYFIIYETHKRIRLLHKKSFNDLATIRIPLYEFDYKEDELQDFEAATFTYEDGKVTTTKVDKNSIFKDKDGGVTIMKFTFPNLKEGCIIEYSYTKVMSNYGNLPMWNFQSEYPELWSEYTVAIPQYFDFVVLQKGYFSPVIDTVIQSPGNYLQDRATEHTWAYKNMPAIKEETYLTDISNYIQSVEFQISALRLLGKETQYFMHTWYQTADELMKSENFGADLNKENGWLKDDLKEAINGEANVIKKVQKIYEYVRDNYTCTNYSAGHLSQPLKKTEQLKKGNIADINMLLAAMLIKEGLNANPVLLSTRAHGKTVDIYPILNKFNYVIVQVTVNDESYLLDASNPILGFNHLDEMCYNGSARIIATEPLIINLSADSLHETELLSLFLSNDEDGKISGTYKYLMGSIHSKDMREKLKKINQDEYFKEVKKSFSFDVDIENLIIDSLKQKEEPVSVQYDISFKPAEDILYFTPLLADGIYKENPFTAAQRYYPVEMPYCLDKTFVFSMEIPKGYNVDELPKPARITLNENEGLFEYLIQQSENQIQLRCRLKLNKANFDPDDYESLRNFYSIVVAKENEQIVFKKQ